MASASELPEWPPKQRQQEEDHIVGQAVDWALSNALIYRPVSEPGRPASAIHAPFSLYPTPFPRRLFAKAKALQEAYNAMYANIACDETFLEQVIGGAVARVDSFQGGLWKIWQTVKQDGGLSQNLQLGLFRSDYLLHSTDNGSLSLRQVEFNTISSSFGPLAGKVSDLHRHLVSSAVFPKHPLLRMENLPKNDALETLASGLAFAAKAQGESDGIILFIVQHPERNAFDQRAIEWNLFERHGLKTRRRTLKQAKDDCKLMTPGNKLMLGDEAVSVVYFRSAYTPNDYHTQDEWDARLLLERSHAIKCPSIALQLAGAKKVQQVLAVPGMVERFLPVQYKEKAQEIRETFMGMWPMDDSELGREGQRLASTESSRFVLKPQREGGGNNIYRDKIRPALDQMAEQDKARSEGEPRQREAYILMELIKPPGNLRNKMVRAGTAEAQEAEIISELGCFGVTLFRSSGEHNGADILQNIGGGHLLRTKGSTDDEGGVAVGFSVIDSPLLVGD